ncbi:vitamin K epoxide reductase family protein [Maribacter arenosus]|uniref:Peptidase C39 domain-containing protein n=1 Tax=Maribacter arenosus TaxID=1854708 RepID=A0ABR7VA42_9FLAO|nr:vitamin K epoxide reductase family protein [Maribacter arenosus]MBD0849417.1 hypothetical protein [Maribacter arenosus]
MFKSKKEPVVSVLHELFKLLNNKITYTTIRAKLLQHPSFQTLFSITNTLTNFGISNKAVKVKTEQLNQLETPFLASTHSGETILVKKSENDYVHFFSPSMGWKNTPLDDFTKMWNKMVILVDTESAVTEEHYKKKKNTELLNNLRFSIVVIFSTLLILGIVFALGSSRILAYFFIKVFGLVVALALVNKEINRNTSYSICKVGKKISCDDVLNSPAAKLFDWLSMTDMGFLYFTGTIIIFVISIIVPLQTSIDLLKLLVITSFLALPYTIFSLFYQGFVIKKWCTLCLATIAALWAEAAVGYYYFSESSLLPNFELKTIFLFSFSLFLPSIIWMFLKKELLKSSGFNTLYFSYLRIKNNWEVFQHVQQKQKEVDMDFLSHEIILGSDTAKNILVVAINPYCPACGREYASIVNLLNKHPNYAKIVIRFVGSFRENDKVKLLTSAMLISHYLKDTLGFQEILGKWFEVGNLNAFVKTYPINHNKMAEDMIKHHYVWSEKLDIQTTPTTYLNNKKLINYSIDQIVDVLDMNTTEVRNNLYHNIN